MKFIHYTDKEFDLKPIEYQQFINDKPSGLWFSVEGDQDWKSWCQDENFQLENLIISYDIKIKNNANILHLQTNEDILNFTNEYPFLRDQWNNPKGREICNSYELDWDKVKSKYQGIIISPYIWECRLCPKCNWYYTWDCASGCVWDIDCIEEFKLIE